MTWRTLLPLWTLLEQDLHNTYGVDADDEQLMAARSWRWLNVRIAGLLNAPTPTRIRSAIAAQRQEVRT